MISKKNAYKKHEVQMVYSPGMDMNTWSSQLLMQIFMYYTINWDFLGYNMENILLYFKSKGHALCKQR